MMNFLMNYWPKIMIDLALSIFSIPLVRSLIWTYIYRY